MRRKCRKKCLLFLFFMISLILLCKFLNRLIHLLEVEKANSNFPDETLIERVPVSHVIALNNFISETPTSPSSQSPQFTHGYYAYNQRLSDKIGAYRALLDTRDEACSERNYYKPQQRRFKVSIIIAFHNEARSILMRTIMSVYRRTPAKYLHEIILVDDQSNDELLLSKLRHLNVPPFQHNFYYATNATTETLTVKDDNKKNSSDFTVIKMQRNSRRLGLIESRNLGARLATGDYLLFLDSHCEVNVGWLEPLLYRVTNAIRTNAVGATNVAVSPILDSIDAVTFQYRQSSQRLMGGFDWNLHFHWIQREMLPHNADGMMAADDENDNENAATATPFKSPVFAGGIFMIERKWFLKLKGFNPLLEIWGGESIEFSIKLWLCGGQIEIVPCSRVGHIFRKEHPFRFPNGDDGQTTYLRNSKIVAESWLDSYKYFFYALKPNAQKINVNISHEELKAFKLRLQCKTFDWYLNHVFPQLRLPNENFIAFGKLSADELCLHVQQKQQPHDVAQFDHNLPIISSSSHKDRRRRLYMTSCYHVDLTHWYLHRYSARLQSSDGDCLNVVESSSKKSILTTFDRKLHFSVVLQYCHQTLKHAQRWIRRGTHLIHEQTQLCLDNPLNDVVAVSHCRRAAPTQSFRFTMEMQKL